MSIGADLPFNENVVWHPHSVTRQDREALHKHRGAVLWFTGLSGSGKSTLAGALEQVLHQRRMSTYLLDGDNIRSGLCRDLSFSNDDRSENTRRVGEMVKLLVDAGLIVLTALISPYRAERHKVRDMLPPGRFIEVFVDTPLEICETRDPKGLYKKSRAGKLHDFTGLDAAYEAPQHPDLHLNGEQLVTDLIYRLLNLLSERIEISS